LFGAKMPGLQPEFGLVLVSSVLYVSVNALKEDLNEADAGKETKK
jgi:hypothetical protein